MVDIWREKVDVRFGSVDRSNRLTIGSVFSFFQEAAISHAADLGVGIDVLEHAGQAWILSRLSIFVERRPFFGETVQVSTWPRKWEKLFALRDYDIRDESGKVIVRGRAYWLIINIEKRRPLRIEPILYFLPPNDGIDAFPAGPAGLGLRDFLTKKMERSALYSDIDYFGHVNNARYIQWIQDATDTDVLTVADQIRLDINYVSEVMPGEAVEIWTAPLAKTGPDEAGASGAEALPCACSADYPSHPGPGFVYEGRRPSGSAELQHQVAFRAELHTGCSDCNKNL